MIGFLYRFLFYLLGVGGATAADDIYINELTMLQVIVCTPPPHAHTK